MKKILSLFIVLVALTQLLVCTSAVYTYEGEGFNITLPDDYRDNGDMSFAGDDGSTISVSVTEYADGEKYNIYFSGDKDLQERANLLADTANAFYKTQKLKAVMKVVSTEKVKHKNGKTVAVSVYETSVKNGKVKNQIVYEFTCVNNLYTFTYTGEKSLDDEIVRNAFDSITIDEKEGKGFLDVIGSYIAGGLIFGGVLVGIVKFIRTPAKRK